MVYLDNAATTMVDERVLAEMMPYLKESYGNPGSKHCLGKEAKEAVDLARSRVAKLFNCEPEQVIFTSGGSESNNLVFAGTAKYLKSINKTGILTSAIEHESVLRGASAYAQSTIDFVNPKKSGVISPRDVEASIKENTGIVSVMYANNETGLVNNIQEICRIAHENGCLFHTDAVQAAGCQSLDVQEIGCDFMSISSHKIHGCKGVGALFVKDKSLIEPIINGGNEQEFGKRGGTENVAGIVGFGKACEIVAETFKESHGEMVLNLVNLYVKINTKLTNAGFPDVVDINGDLQRTGGKTISLSFKGIDAETLLLMLRNKVCASSGSACRSSEVEPSYVLEAMGISDDVIRSSVRFSVSKFTTEEEIETASNDIVECVKALIRGGN